jgi:kynurenine 3-monooxygenase
MQTQKKIAIVGSGLVGSLAIYLRKAGHTVHLYDRSPDIRQIQFSGRSINLAMSNRVGKRSMVLGYRIQFTKSQYPWTNVLFTW